MTKSLLSYLYSAMIYKMPCGFSSMPLAWYYDILLRQHV